MANKNLLKSKAVLKAISIGLAAMMAMTPVVGATDVYADETEPEGTPEGATELQQSHLHQRKQMVRQRLQLL